MKASHGYSNMDCMHDGALPKLLPSLSLPYFLWRWNTFCDILQALKCAGDLSEWKQNDCVSGRGSVLYYSVWKTGPVLHFHFSRLECGPMPNMMAALPNMGGALYSTPQIWLTPTTRVSCSNAAKTRNPLKFAGTRQQISAVSRLKFTILSGHVEDVLLFDKFFFELSIHALVPKI